MNLCAKCDNVRVCACVRCCLPSGRNKYTVDGKPLLAPHIHIHRMRSKLKPLYHNQYTNRRAHASPITVSVAIMHMTNKSSAVFGSMPTYTYCKHTPTHWHSSKMLSPNRRYFVKSQCRQSYIFNVLCQRCSVRPTKYEASSRQSTRDDNNSNDHDSTFKMGKCSLRNINIKISTGEF